MVRYRGHFVVLSNRIILRHSTSYTKYNNNTQHIYPSAWCSLWCKMRIYDLMLRNKQCNNQINKLLHQANLLVGFLIQFYSLYLDCVVCRHCCRFSIYHHIDRLNHLNAGLLRAVFSCFSISLISSFRRSIFSSFLFIHRINLFVKHNKLSVLV